MASTIRITDSFTIVAENGEVFNVQEHTPIDTGKVAGVKRETMGDTYLKTDGGRGVIKNDDGSFSIPSLKVTAHRSA
jgi:hypothetical protein